MKKIITSESVTEGHPDKICDYIADSILDYALTYDPDAQMAVEVSVKDDYIFVFGEATTTADIPYEMIARNALWEIGYEYDPFVSVLVREQSPEINQAVTKEGQDALAAGDQGIMFGYATNETDTYMPAAIYYAHKLTKKLNEVFCNRPNILGPDGKAQVSVVYENDKPIGIDTIVLSTQHTEDINMNDLRSMILNEVIYPVIPHAWLDNARVLINPSGSFVMGGAWADSGTTGRKIVCDSYGADCPVGGGCYSSKNGSKVDRSAAYYCRYVAKNIVAAGLADKLQVHVAYAIGRPEPINITINTFGTGKVNDFEILNVIKHNFDFSVANIIRELDLKRPIYRETTNYGHFGKPDLPWEQIKELEI